MDIILVFETTHNALNAEQLLLHNNITIELLPTPREISASCGISIKVGAESLLEVRDLMDSGALRVLAVYEMDKLEKTLVRRI